MRRLKVLIADDHRLMLHSIRVALEADEEIEIVAEVDSGTKVIPFIGQTGPDLVLLDIRMPGIDGLTVLERIRERYPQVKVAILSGVDDPSVIHAAFDRGAAAYIVKHVDPRDLPSALRQAVEGTVFQPLGALESVTNGAAEDVELTKREQTILEALQTGRSNKQIAEKLFLAEQTVKFHLTHIYKKLGVSSRAGAVATGCQNGLIDDLFEAHRQPTPAEPVTS